MALWNRGQPQSLGCRAALSPLTRDHGSVLECGRHRRAGVIGDLTPALTLADVVQRLTLQANRGKNCWTGRALRDVRGVRVLFGLQRCSSTLDVGNICRCHPQYL